MNSLSDSLHFVTYADFSQSTLHTNGLHSTLHDSSAFQSLHTPYPSFALLPLPPPQLHQPTVDVTKKTKKPHPPEPTRVTRPPNAFLLFNREMRKVLKDENPRMKVAEISKEIGSRWKLLGQADKAAYMAEADKLKETQRALHPNAMYIRRSKAELVKAGHYPRPKPKPKTVYVDSTLYLLPDPSQPTTAEKMTRKRQKRD
ncbi:high mobility group box domain-containing protein, partial [Spinellus fusiger]